MGLTLLLAWAVAAVAVAVSSSTPPAVLLVKAVLAPEPRLQVLRGPLSVEAALVLVTVSLEATVPDVHVLWLTEEQMAAVSLVGRLLWI